MKNEILILGLIINSLLSFGQSMQLTDEQVNKSGAMYLMFAESLEEAKTFGNTGYLKWNPISFVAKCLFSCSLLDQ